MHEAHVKSYTSYARHIHHVYNVYMMYIILFSLSLSFSLSLTHSLSFSLSLCHTHTQHTLKLPQHRRSIRQQLAAINTTAPARQTTKMSGKGRMRGERRRWRGSNDGARFCADARLCFRLQGTPTERTTREGWLHGRSKNYARCGD